MADFSNACSLACLFMHTHFFNGWFLKRLSLDLFNYTYRLFQWLTSQKPVAWLVYWYIQTFSMLDFSNACCLTCLFMHTHFFNGWFLKLLSLDLFNYTYRLFQWLTSQKPVALLVYWYIQTFLCLTFRMPVAWLVKWYIQSFKCLTFRMPVAWLVKWYRLFQWLTFRMPTAWLVYWFLQTFSMADF